MGVGRLNINFKSENEEKFNQEIISKKIYLNKKEHSKTQTIKKTKNEISFFLRFDIQQPWPSGIWLISRMKQMLPLSNTINAQNSLLLTLRWEQRDLCSQFYKGNYLFSQARAHWRGELVGTERSS